MEINFFPGLNTITGETGTGKSILLGALGLLLGSRADSSQLKDNEQKGIIEGKFAIDTDEIRIFFKLNDLDAEFPIVLRREILPNGKSRAFVNDTPVSISLLRELGNMLVDIHSQHQNLLASDKGFQRKILDAVSSNSEFVEQYKNSYSKYKNLQLKSKTLQEEAEKAASDLDYFKFQVQQIDSASISDTEELQNLENEAKVLSHSIEIKESLSNAIYILDSENDSAISLLKQAKNYVIIASKYLDEVRNISDRLNSLFIELKDINEEISRSEQKWIANPERLAQVSERIDFLNQLCHKHRVSNLAELLQVRNEFHYKIGNISLLETEIENINSEIINIEIQLFTQAEVLFSRRCNSIPFIQKQITGSLKKLGINSPTFIIECIKNGQLNESGFDTVEFCFSANPDSTPQEIGKIASGGELSRLMLSIKSLVSKAISLPTIVFDEIDTGVSGSIADQVGDMINLLSESVQILNITHLPQIAAKGNNHFKVSKESQDGKTATTIHHLNETERLTEIASMLSGKKITDAALLQASQLLSLGK